MKCSKNIASLQSTIALSQEKLQWHRRVRGFDPQLGLPLTATHGMYFAVQPFEFVRAFVYMAFQSVFFESVDEVAAGGKYAPRPAEGAWETALSKLVTARAFIMPSDERAAAVAPKGGPPIDGGMAPFIFSSIKLSKLFMLRLWRTPIEGGMPIDGGSPYPMEGSAGAPGLPPAPNPWLAASFNRLLGPGRPPKPREVIRVGGSLGWKGFRPMEEIGGTEALAIAAAMSPAFETPTPPKDGIWSTLTFRISSTVGMDAVGPSCGGRLADAPNKKSSLFFGLLLLLLLALGGVVETPAVAAAFAAATPAKPSAVAFALCEAALMAANVTDGSGRLAFRRPRYDGPNMVLRELSAMGGSLLSLFCIGRLFPCTAPVARGLLSIFKSRAQ